MTFWLAEYDIAVKLPKPATYIKLSFPNTPISTGIGVPLIMAFTASLTSVGIPSDLAKSFVEPSGMNPSGISLPSFITPATVSFKVPSPPTQTIKSKPAPLESVMSYAFLFFCVQQAVTLYPASSKRFIIFIIYRFAIFLPETGFTISKSFLALSSAIMVTLANVKIRVFLQCILQGLK